ncbi:MAG TPA: TIGR03809 family protein [Xanthobacteraceae bacterium]|nr:TIGR03809 family protein [Xanthobacteraceae bacterium]
MTKVLTAEAQRNNAEQQLFVARRALAHLVEMYDNGRWRSYYKQDAFAEAVRQARQAVDYWTDIVNKCASGSAAAR